MVKNTGVVGGSYYKDTGGAANTLCLTEKPEYDDDMTQPPHLSDVYGAEYEEGGSHQNRDVPCCVCRAPQSTSLMVPATRTCPRGWTAHYTGHLTAGDHAHNAASEYLCLDGSPEDLPGGEENLDGRLLYYAAARCGSLRCPPFDEGRVLTCVVCSM